tara:strand:- start:5961 stop:6425 length:465 start_codon:yes stop_codon:yes gene_type:complete
MATSNEPNNLSKKRQNTAARIIEALGSTQGLLSLAARKAGVSYSTVKRYAAESPTVKQAVQDAKSSTLDFAEGKLYQAISQGNLTAIIFYLKTQGKARGYIERSEFTGSDGEPLAAPIINLHMPDGTVVKPPRNGHDGSEAKRLLSGPGDNGAH